MPTQRLTHLLKTPQSVSEVTDAQWNGIVEAGRKNQLLGQLAAALRRAGVFELVLPAVQRHLALDELTAQRRAEAALWELKGMRRAIDPSVPLVVLKGCAYMVAGDVNAGGRLFSDVDLMVPRAHLDAVESSLISVGWKPSRVNDYDLAYYRNWMHEVPPMEHVRRHTVCDLHHAINPPVSRYYIPPEKLFAHLVEVLPGIHVLSPTDRVIHCALHLLQEGEPKKLIRDLYDLHLLLQQHFGADQGLTPLLLRADELGVGAPTKTAVAAAQSLFVDNTTAQLPKGWLQKQVEIAALSTLDKGHLSGELAGWAVLAHSHWMKMPLRLLVPHLTRKTWVTWFPDKEV
ncbi:nucleotidyltransferase family protein [Rhodoferax sp. BLA1]|uniref:nucleotidyltransferase domain-containing protein n=1 Tax=Rhodoferax sp. BLA1 TaxID=2576062 RepID=UPI0015D211EA|nr:nucleotidyltransferase family protein [Rhodoferax sp. BLA1]